MPIVYIHARPGLPSEKKNTLMKSISDAVETAYRVGDTLVFIRQHQIHNVSMNGVPQTENPKIKEVLRRIQE